MKRRHKEWIFKSLGKSSSEFHSKLGEEIHLSSKEPKTVKIKEIKGEEVVSFLPGVDLRVKKRKKIMF
jgi:hypothetical protein